MTKREVLDLINEYYPADISAFDDAYFQTVEHIRLEEILEKESHNNEWINWVNTLKSNSQWVVFNVSAYSFASPCHRVHIGYFSDKGNFEIKLFISIISPFLLIRVNELQKTDYGNRPVIEGEHIIHIDSLDGSYFISNLKDANPELLPQLKKIIQLIEKLPSPKTFLPALLIHEIVPSRSTNKKKAGTATIFNLLFDDLAI